MTLLPRLNTAISKQLRIWWIGVLHKKGLVCVKSMQYHGKKLIIYYTLFNVERSINFRLKSKNLIRRVENGLLSGWRLTSWAGDTGLVGEDQAGEKTWLGLPDRILHTFGMTKSPQKEGIYQFKINYKKRIRLIKKVERVTIRPYKHD